MKRLFGLIFLFIMNFSVAQEIKYSSGNDSWNADSLGNHRAVVHFNGEGKVARIIIPWRLNMDSMEKKRIIVQDATTGNKIMNVKTGIVNNESGEIYFEPISGKADYNIYYLPYKNEGRSNYPKGVYLKPENTVDENWMKTISQKTPVNTAVKEIQSINAFNSFYPMEVTATKGETDLLISKNKSKPFLVFPEDRMNSIRMKAKLPYKWIKNGTQLSFNGSAPKGENYAYQLGVYALQNLDDVSVSFTEMKNKNGSTINVNDISCINNHGVDYSGKPFDKHVSVEKNNVQALWCLIDVPQNIQAGLYSGKATVTAKGTQPVTINISLNISDSMIQNGGVNEPYKQTRLKWLNSTLAQDNTVIAPYTSLQGTNKIIDLLGRKLEINDDGFPKQIQTFFTEEMTSYQQQANNILLAPIHFTTTDANGKLLQWKNTDFQFIKKEAGTIEWMAVNTTDDLKMEVNASIEFDGFMVYKVKISALNDVQLNDIALQIPYKKSSSIYLMGLGQKGSYRPKDFEWKWDVAHKNQDGAWLGTVNAGLQFSLRDEKYVRPLNTNFYLQKPLLLPSSWGNENKGGITIKENSDTVLVNGYSGSRSMKKGDVLYYNFTLLITPFHTINTDFQWSTRFYHKYDNLDSIKVSGATVVNIHHATPINPWINYPFIEYKKMKAYIDEAHSKGLKVKIYNTVRELSDHAYETFALRSLGTEIYSTGKGGGFSWLQEHVHDNYIAAWFVPEIKDAALINSGISRWHNYYVEGMNWLVQNVGIDGIYLDDVAFDRTTMKRIKRVLTEDGHPGIIDLHSANQYNKSDGFNNSGNLYMEHFPYLNRLWFGEYFDYNKNTPDFFLTEVSGIPFGLMGEMLQDGGNPWRGMIYGMTNRFPWTEDADPRPIWKFWNEYGMNGTVMIGYWSSNCPVKTNNEKILATVYKKNKSALIDIASWAEADANIQLQIDWNKLGIDSSKAIITASEIKNFQLAKTFSVNEQIPVEKGKGWLLIVKEKD
ncbi:MAG TPA: glycoside hydrolase domain-containing protein [Puia sp.]|nr:glycoside hydrolase domain-containing protein [Puia sp.]